MRKILAITALFALFFTACKKVENLPNYGNGEAVTLTASKTAVTSTAADSNTAVISFSWSDPKYAADTSTYKYILEIDSTTRNFAKKSTKIVTGVKSTSLTGKELNNILLNYGFTLGSPYNLDIRVVSSYGNNNERYVSNVVKLAVTPYSDPSVFTSTQTAVTLALATANTSSLTFNWSRSFNGYNGIVTYTLQYDSATKNFASPHETLVGASLLTKGMTQGEMNATALAEGIPGGNLGKLEYRIKAQTAQGAIVYSNAVAVTIQSYLPILRFYLAGSFQVAGGYGPDNWTPATGPEFIRDLRSSVFNDMYYMYIYLPAGSEFKVTQGRSWDVNYGGSAGALSTGGANLSVGAAGYYRISINRTTLRYDIREGRMGFVGNATGANWDPPTTFPGYAMGAAGTNLFVGLTVLANSGEWKMIDNNAWNNGSNAVDETRSYGTAGASGSLIETNGPNFAAPSTAGRYRVIWDGRDVNGVKYEMSPATEMRVVGNGINGVNDWDPPTSPAMTYSGNGVWTIVISLKANMDIKFVAGNAWGAFDYEDNSGGTQATGVARKIKWEGGDNFKTPTTAGTYTITLNEHTQTVTIN